jgi:hypothetical protein
MKRQQLETLIVIFSDLATLQTCEARLSSACRLEERSTV